MARKSNKLIKGPTDQLANQSEPPMHMSGLRIGILGGNSQDFFANHSPFIDLLKKEISAKGGYPLFFSLSGGMDDNVGIKSIVGNGKLENGKSHSTIAYNYGLPSRDIIADQIEILVHQAQLDGLIMLPWSVHSAVGMMMATIRCGISVVFTPRYDQWELFSLIHAANAQIKNDIETPSYTQCSMLILMEVMGMVRIGTLDYFLNARDKNQTDIPVLKKDVVQTFDPIGNSEWAAHRILDLAKQKISPRRFFSAAAFHNALCADIAMGSSTESILHLSALAYESGLPFPLTQINEISKKVSVQATMDKSGEFSILSMEECGGVRGLIASIQTYLQQSPTIIGKNIVDLARDLSLHHSSLKLAKPTKKHGGMAVFYGNLATDGAIFRISGVKEQWFAKSAVAKVYDSESACIEAIATKKVKKEDAVVIRYCGPKGSPGMPLLHGIKKALQSHGLEESVLIISDGRIPLSGKTPAFLHLSPEAAVGSALSIIQTGDIIFWNLEDRSLTVRLTDTEIKVRLSRWREQVKNMRCGYLFRYAKYSSPSSIGAILI